MSLCRVVAAGPAVAPQLKMPAAAQVAGVVAQPLEAVEVLVMAALPAAAAAVAPTGGATVELRA
jgi:hypothetical protein